MWEAGRTVQAGDEVDLEQVRPKHFYVFRPVSFGPRVVSCGGQTFIRKKRLENVISFQRFGPRPCCRKLSTGLDSETRTAGSI